MSSDKQPSPKRLAAITRATDELARCVSERGAANPETRFGVTLGEVDWLWELHNLLYEESEVVIKNKSTEENRAFWNHVELISRELESGFPTEAAERKGFPVATGVFDYFPLALMEVARVSKIGNDQHNPGEPLHWAKEKSQDEEDAMMRHFLQRFEMDTDGSYHAAKMCWRALAFFERFLEAKRRGMSYQDFNKSCREQK